VVADFSFVDSLCGSYTVQFTNNSTNAGTFVWFFKNTSPAISNLQSPNKTFPSAGTYEVTLIASGATGSDTVKKMVHLFDKPAFTITGPATSICPGSVAYLSATFNALYKYIWTPGFTLDDSLISNPQASPLSATRFYLLVADINSHCIDTASFFVDVQSCKPPQALFVIDPIACGNFNVTFRNRSKNLYSCLWNFGDNGSGTNDTSSTTDSMITHTFSSAGTFQVSLIVYDSLKLFSDTMVMSIAVGNTITASIVANRDSVCGGDSIILNTSGGSTYQWIPDAWFDAYTPTDSVYIIRPRKSIVYKLVASLNGCIDTAEILVHATAIPSFTFLSDTACAKQATRFWLKPMPIIKDATFHWNFGADTSDDIQPKYIFTAGKGDYPVSLRYNYRGCDTVINHTVTVYKIPEVKGGYDPQEIFSDSPTVTFLNNTTGATHYLWDFGDGQTSTNIGPVHTFADSGTFYVTQVAYNEKNCTDTAKYTLLVRPRLLLEVPNAFTPNRLGPPENETYHIWSNERLPEFKFMIFNKYGQRVFETTDQYFHWDGTYKDQPCQAGIYIWRMYYRISSEKGKNEVGDLMLYR
jgi:gliding motility-associated-like protein